LKSKSSLEETEGCLANPEIPMIERLLIDGLLKVADTLLGLRDRVKKADADRRQRVSLYFDNVSRCLSNIAKAFRDNTKPWQACGELEEYNTHKCEVAIAEVFGEDLANELRSELGGLTFLPAGGLRLLGEIATQEVFGDYRPQEEILAESIIKIEKAAGKLKALSVLASTSGK
jgi:hypothetical protein